MFKQLFHRLSTGRTQDAALERVLKSHKDALTEHRERIERLEIELKRAHALIEEHYQQLHKVRGKVYGTASRQNSGVGAIPFGDKAALRAAVGISAGKVFQHPEE